VSGFWGLLKSNWNLLPSCAVRNESRIAVNLCSLKYFFDFK